LTQRASYVVRQTSEVIDSRAKPAILENGRKIKVPPFIEAGETIMVDLKQELFYSRANE